jgi:glycosyltransferase involved in cell wall biosynthesis
MPSHLGKSGEALDNSFSASAGPLSIRPARVPSLHQRPLVTHSAPKASSCKLTVIIPVYDEEATVGQLIDQVCSVRPGADLEVIVVDDGSSDNSPTIIREKAHLLAGIHINPVNAGKGTAVRRGLEYATGDIVIIQDADLELVPSEYRKILDPIMAGDVSVVFGSRFLTLNPNVPCLTRWANYLLTWLTNLLYSSNLSDMCTAYKAFRVEALRGLDLRCSRFDFDPEVTARLLRKGYRVVEVPVSYRPRSRSEGKKIRWVDGLRAIVTLIRCRF